MHGGGIYYLSSGFLSIFEKSTRKEVVRIIKDYTTDIFLLRLLRPVTHSGRQKLLTFKIHFLEPHHTSAHFFVISDASRKENNWESPMLISHRQATWPR